MTFVEGRSIWASARIEGDLVRLDVPGGEASFPRRAFASIVADDVPEREWPRRLAIALKGDDAARYAVSWWALCNGLADEAIVALRAAPTHSKAKAMLQALERLSEAPKGPEATRFVWPANAPRRETRGAHVVLRHDLPEAEARERVELMDRVVVTFVLAMTAEGAELRAPNRPLRTVRFPNRSSYHAYLETERAGFLGTRGHYHPVRRLVAICGTKSPTALASETDPRRFLDALDRRESEIGALAHEMVHALVAATGLEPAPRRFPYWLHEGLAMQFEGTRGGRWAGIMAPLPERSQRLARRAAPLDLRAVISDVGFGRGADPNAYDPAWSLVRYLWSQEARGLFDYLERSRVSTEAFGAVFGPDLEGLADRWRAWSRAEVDHEKHKKTRK